MCDGWRCLSAYAWQDKQKWTADIQADTREQAEKRQKWEAASVMHTVAGLVDADLLSLNGQTW